MRVWDTVNMASRQLNIPAATIQAVLANKLDNGGGFMWRPARERAKEEGGEQGEGAGELEEVGDEDVEEGE